MCACFFSLPSFIHSRCVPFLAHFLFLIFVFFPSHIPSPSVHTHMLYYCRCVLVLNMSESIDGQCIRLNNCTRGRNKVFELVGSSITVDQSHIFFDTTSPRLTRFPILSMCLFWSSLPLVSPPIKESKALEIGVVVWHRFFFSILLQPVVYEAINVWDCHVRITFWSTLVSCKQTVKQLPVRLESEIIIVLYNVILYYKFLFYIIWVDHFPCPSLCHDSLWFWVVWAGLLSLFKNIFFYICSHLY